MRQWRHVSFFSFYLLLLLVVLFIVTDNTAFAQENNATNETAATTVAPSSSLHPSLHPSSLPSLFPSSPPSLSPRTFANTCAGYIERRGSYNATTGPFPIDCSNQTFSRWGPPEMQANACCTDEGRFAVQAGLVGGFDITYAGSGSSGVNYRCLAYTEALRATLCDPTQGQHVVITPANETIFRVCLSSCNAVVAECGLPGDGNYPKDLSYTDGESMCYEAWGGWYDSSPCANHANQFPCSISALEIVNDGACLSIVYPTDATLEVYKETRQPPDACDPAVPSRLGIFVVVLVVVTVSLSVCGTLIYMHARHRQAEEDFS